MTVTEQLSALESILAHGDLHSLFQPRGAVLHAQLQGLVAALECVLGHAERGDIGERGDEAL